MRPWIKRTLFSVAGLVTVFGLAACGHQPFGGDSRGDGMGMSRHGQHSPADMQKHRDRMIERVTSQLSLDDAQKAKFATLLDTMHAKRAAMMGASAASGPAGGKGPGMGGMPMAQMQELIKGERFDRARAQALVDEKANALRTASPDVIAAMGDFYDSLKPEQQTKVREFMARGHGHRGMMGGHRG